MTDPLIAELEATNRLQADDIARLKGALERAKLLEDALNNTIDALESVVERQSRRLTELFGDVCEEVEALDGGAE